MKTLTMKTTKISALLTALFILSSTGWAQTTYSILHKFPSEPTLAPIGTAIVAAPDGTLYGYSSSSLVRFNPDGTSVTVHTFTGGNDGSTPIGKCIISGNTLYGTTSAGGVNGFGTVFKVNTDGTGFTTLFAFTGGDDGGQPEAALTLDGNTLYGTTAGNPDPVNYGSVFKINTDGSGFQALQTFWDTNGANPVCTLVVTNGVVYGTTPYGGPGNNFGPSDGTIFKVNTDGTGFALVMDCYETGRPIIGGGYIYSWPNGQQPNGNLAISGNTLYASEVSGGIFSINADGTGFAGIYNPPSSYLAGLILSGNTLFGLGSGELFSVNTNGTGFTSLVNAGVDDFTLQNGVIYGTAQYQFSYSYYQVIFKMNQNGTGYTNLTQIPDVFDGRNPNGLVIFGNTLFGTTSFGGTNDWGSIFRVNTDGSGYHEMYAFNSPSDGAYPVSGLIVSGNALYGTTSFGGTNADGTLFKINLDGSGFTILHSFGASATGDSGAPTNADGFGAVIGAVSGNTIYGTANSGGTNGSGTVFKVNTDGTDFALLHAFGAVDPTSNANGDGGDPCCLALQGSTVYVGTADGGTNGSGVIFTMDTNGANFSLLHTFAPLVEFTNTDGSIIYTNSDGNGSGLIVSGNILYGSSYSEGLLGGGNLFKLNIDGTGFTILYNFDPGTYSGDTYTNSDGAYPNPSSIYLSGGRIYGSTQGGGLNGAGTIFSINADGTGFSNIYEFSGGTDGANPAGNLVLSDNTLYGTAGGTLFALSLGPIPLNAQSNGNMMNLSWGNPGFSLQGATNLLGPWANVPGASSPCNIPITVTAPQQFFRLTSTNGP